MIKIEDKNRLPNLDDNSKENIDLMEAQLEDEYQKQLNKKNKNKENK